MLKLDPVVANQIIELRYRKCNTLFDRALQRAFLYSVLFHALLFGVFRIKLLAIPLTPAILNPVEVALDAEKIEENFQETVAIAPNEERITAPMNDQSLLTIPVDSFHLINNFLFQATTTPSPTLIVNNDETELLSLLSQEKSELDVKYKERLYPLQLELSGDIAHLAIIEDGSILFKERTIKHKAATFKLATNVFPIDYRVVVSNQSGAIIQWSRKKELLDKNLQNCADKLIQTIRFVPKPWAEKETIRGKLWIIFACTGNELKEYLQ